MYSIYIYFVKQFDYALYDNLIIMFYMKHTGFIFTFNLKWCENF